MRRPYNEDNRDDLDNRDSPCGPDDSTNAAPDPRGTQPGSLGSIIQSFKAVSTRKVNRLRETLRAPLWQRNYYEHVVRNEQVLERIRLYVESHPVQWEFDEENPANVF